MILKPAQAGFGQAVVLQAFVRASYKTDWVSNDRGGGWFVCTGILPCKPITFKKKGTESDNWVELKGSKVCWKSSKSVEKRSVMKWKVWSEVKSYLTWSVAKSNEVKWSEVNEAKWSGMRWSEVQYREGGRVFMEKFYRSTKWWEVKDWGESASELVIVKKKQLQETVNSTLLLGCFCLLYML